jgi:hypothetical protein
MDQAKEDRFFIWIPRNLLKSLDSTKRIQGNASLFAWISLVYLAFIWRCRDGPYPTCFFKNSSVRVQASLALGAS